jgi:hypothetical protein
VAVEWGGGPFPAPSRASLATRTRARSGDTTLQWSGGPGFWQVDSPRSKLFAGFAEGKVVKVGELQLLCSSKWLAGGLSALDDQPIPTSKRLLLVLAGRAENIDMKWNADHNSIGNGWGTGPTYVEGIDTGVRIATDGADFQVWALDESGQTRQLVPSSVIDGVLRFQASPQYRTLWYEIDSQ